jgi:hypothetical protein
MRLGKFLVLSGLLLLIWGIVGWFLSGDAGDAFYTDAMSNIFYMILGAIVLWSGITWNPEVRRPWTKIFGIILGVVAILGWALSGGDAPNLGIINMETTDNSVNSALALAFLWAGFYGKKDDVYLEPPGTTMNIS